MNRKLTFCVSVGLSFNLILSFYKDYILVDKSNTSISDYKILDPRAVPKSPKLDFLLVETPIGLSTGRI